MKTVLFLAVFIACALGASQVKNGPPKFPMNRFGKHLGASGVKKVPKFPVNQFLDRVHSEARNVKKGAPKFPLNNFHKDVFSGTPRLRKGFRQFPVHQFQNRSPLSKIIQGNISEPNEFPFTVSIQRRGVLSWGHSCGGSIIADHWVLTSAACLNGIANLANARVVGGENNLVDTTGFEQLREVKQLIQHPQYNADFFVNDLALIETAGAPFDFSGEGVKPVALPSQQNQDYASGTPVTIAGWGQINPGGFNVNDQRKADVFIRSDAECRSKYGNSTIRDSMICAGLPQGGTDPCDGDYGGPLFTTNNGAFEQVGIASWDQECASAIFPAVYTQVSYFLDWINSHINGNGTSN